MSFIAELNRRNVVRTGLLYLVASWLLLQVGDVLFGALELPPWSVRLVLGILILGFPLTLIFSWVYELTPEGLKREHEVERNASITAATARKLNVLIVVLLLAATGLLVANRFLPGAAPADVAATAAPGAIPATDARAKAGEPSIAVLPFVNMSGDPDNEYFSDGLSEELLNVLRRCRAGHRADSRVLVDTCDTKDDSERKHGDPLIPAEQARRLAHDLADEELAPNVAACATSHAAKSIGQVVPAEV